MKKTAGAGGLQGGGSGPAGKAAARPEPRLWRAPGTSGSAKKAGVPQTRLLADFLKCLISAVLLHPKVRNSGLTAMVL